MPLIPLDFSHHRATTLHRNDPAVGDADRLRRADDDLTFGFSFWIASHWIRAGSATLAPEAVGLCLAARASDVRLRLTLGLRDLLSCLRLDLLTLACARCASCTCFCFASIASV